MSTDTNESLRPSVVLRIGKHPVAYAVLVMLAVGALVFFFAIVPFTRMLQNGGKASITDAQNRLQSAKNVLEAQKKLVDTATALTAKDRANLAYAVPAEPDIPGLYIIFNSLAARSGVKLSSIDMAEAAEAAPEQGDLQSVGKLRISVSLDQVSYDRLKIVLTNVEGSLRLFDIRGWAFSPSTGSVSMQMDAYYLTKS